MSDTKDFEFTQNDILRLFDVVSVGFIFGAIMVCLSIFSFNVYLLLGVAMEVSGCGLFFWFANKKKNKLKAIGKWKKLTLKESINLHEWWRVDEE